MSTKRRSLMARAGTQVRRVSRLLRYFPQLIFRSLRHRGKWLFLRSLINTYYSNYINLSLVFRRTRSDWEIRGLALRAVLTYLRNSALYNLPKIWNGFELHNSEALDATLARGKGVVVACQHLGPQRYGFIEIALRGCKVHAAMTEQFIDRGQRWFDQVVEDLEHGPQVEAIDRITLLPVEHRTCALKMVRALRRGEAVMFDVDGNIGVGGEGRTLEETMTLPFLGRKIHVRSGVAYLSYRTGAPIVPLIPLWGTEGQPELHFYDPIIPEENETLEEFAEQSLRQLYGLLEQKLLERPEQWEMWPYFFKWLSPPEKLEQAEDLEDQTESLVARLREALKRSPDQVVRVRPYEAFVLRIRGKRVFVDSRNFRFFLTSSMTEKALELLHRGTTLGEVAQRLERKYPLEVALKELAKLEILNLLIQQPEPA